MNKHFDLFDILILIGIIFIGTDVWSINLIANIRLIQIYYLFVVIYLLLTSKYRLYINKFLILFLLSASLSVIFSISILNSLLYYIWVIYDFIILIPIFYCYIREKGSNQILKLISITYRIIIPLIFIQYIIDGTLHIELSFLSSQHHMGVTRPALWFYEPSYLASFMLIYLGISTYQAVINKKYIYIIDIIFTILTLIIITSTTGFIGIVLTFVLCFILYLCYTKDKKKRIIATIGSIIIIILLFLGIKLFLPNVYNLFIERLFRDGLISSAGDRITNYSNQINAFLSSPLVGVGLDAYGAFMGDETIVATNITLELLACQGVLGFCSFYLFLFYPIVIAYFGKNKNKLVCTKPIALALFILIVILQANQNYMRLYLWMMIIICYGSIDYELYGKIDKEIILY